MKRIAQIFSVLCIVCLLCAVAQADTMSRVSVQDAFLGEGSELKVIVHSTLDEARNPEECFAELDEQRVAIKGVQPYAETGEGTSWVFLTDTATVSTDGGAEPIKASLGGLIANMKDEDNAVLVSTGMSFEGLELISDKNALDEQIDKMASSANQTLYATISEAVTFLTTQSNVRPHACIVILSSGKTDSEEGMTLAELQKVIADANVTVYTVAFTMEASDALTDYFTLARNGCGGISIKVPIKPEVGEVITPIVENENRFYMMTTAPLTTTGEKLRVYVSCNDKYVMGELLLNVKLQERIAGVVETAETIEAVEEPDMQGIYVGCAVLLVVIVICAVILSRRSAKKKREAAEALVPDVPSVLEGETEIEDAPKASVTMVSLTVLGKEKCFKGEMKDQLVVGRNPEPDGIRIDLDDEKMSRSHFVLRNVAGVLFIENVGKNGTYVNNVKINQVVEVHQQDVITIGTTNLKISWIAY